jgi:hypothetical protein
MKNIKLSFAIIAVIMLVGLTNCKKEADNIPVKKYVDAIDGSFNVQYGDISIAKNYSPPIINWSEWRLLREDGSLVDGSEFINGSAAWKWWHAIPSGRNPVGFPASQLTYPNVLLPDENLRMIIGVQNWSADNIYLGMIDFNPENVQFPLTIQSYRLGDYLAINADALTNLPGANLTITVSFQLKNLNLVATRTRPWNPALPFGFDQIIYENPQSVTVSAGSTPNSGESVLYSGFSQKVFGPIVVTIIEAATSTTSVNVYTVTVPADKVGIPGKGTLLKLTTTKVGWYNSGTISIPNQDIAVQTVEVPIN